MPEKTLKILAIDDNADNLITVQAVLADLFPNVQVLTAISGEKGLELAQAQDPDVILLDIIMPGMDGYEVCRRIKTSQQTSAIPVIFLTALKADRQSRLHALEVGAEGFLTKPIDEVELTAQIQAMAKIKAMNSQQKTEKEQLSALVDERTAALQHELEENRKAAQALKEAHRRLEQNQTATLNLLEDLKEENEARKQTEKALREREYLLNKIFDLLPVGLWFADKDGALQRGNPTGVKIWGAEPHVTPAEYGVFKARFLPSGLELQPEDWALGKTIQEGLTITGELLEIDAFDGKTKIILNSSAPVLDDEGNIQGAIVLNQDITNEYQMQAELSASEKRFRALIENNTDAIVLTDANGSVLYESPAYERMLGFAENKRLGESVLEAIHPEDSAEVNRLFDSLLLQPGAIENASFRNLHADGSWHWLEATAKNLLDEPAVNGIVINMQDITARKLAQDALQERERELSTLMDNLPGMAYRCKNDSEWTMTFVSVGCAEITGYLPEDLIDNRTVSYGSLVHPDDLERTEQEAQKAITNSDSFTLEYRLLDKNRTEHWVWDHGSAVIGASGEVESIEGFITDITERKQLEAAVQSRLVALTRPLDQPGNLEFEDLFDMEMIQRLQDEFSAATGVASVITRPDGTPITRSSNFCSLCFDVIRQTELGKINCYRSDAALGRYHPGGPIIQPCLSGGLWDAGANISVGGRHIANWLVGQVRDETQTEEKMRASARDIGANEEEFITAFQQVPFMSQAQFAQVAQSVFTLAGQLSNMAYQNLQQARFITERKQAEETLKERERELSTLMDNLPGMAYRSTNVPFWTMLFVSQGSLELTGYRPDELIQNSVLSYNDLIHPDDREKVWQEVESAIAARRPFVLVYRIQDKNGTERWVWERGSAIYDGNGDAETLEGFITDITERRRMDQAILESESRFRLLYEQSPGPYQSLDEEGFIREVNNAWLDELGYERSEVIGHWFGDFLSEPDSELFPQRFAYFKKAGVVHNVEFQARHRDNSLIDISFEGRIARDNAGNFLQTHCVFSNVTEQKRRQAQLRQYTDDLNRAQTVARIGSWKWTIPTNHLEWSDQMYTIFGIDKESFTGDLADVITRAIHPDDRAAVEASNRSVAKDGKPIPLEYRVIHPDGSVRTLWAEAGEMILDADAEGRPQALTGIVQDISERKAAEQQLRDSESKFSLAFESSPYAISITDPVSGVYMEVNQAFEDMSGYTRAEVLGKSVMDLNLWFNLDERKEFMEELSALGSITGKEIAFRHKHGTPIICVISAVILSLNGKPHVLAIINDISAQKQAQAQLLLQDAALKAAANGIVITDLHANIEWANPAFTTLTGYSLDEALGKNPRDLVKSSLQDEEVYADMWQTLMAGEEWRGEFINRRKDGTLYNESQIITPIRNAAGEISNFIAIKEDITLRKQQEQRLLHQTLIQDRLVAMGRALGATMDINMIYRIAYRYVRSIMDVPGLGISLYDPDDKKLHLVFAINDYQIIDTRPYPGYAYSPDDLSTDRARVMATQQPIVTNDLAAKTRASGGMFIGETGAEPQSAIYVPMVAEGKSIGVLDLQSYDRDEFTQETGEWLSVVANQVALAVQNARLYEQVRKRVSQLSGLREIDSAINAHQPMADIYQLVLNQIRYQLNVDAADILLLDPDQQKLSYASGFGFEDPSAELVIIPLGKGLAGRVAQSGRIMQHDSGDDNDALRAECQACTGHCFASHIGLPLKKVGAVQGVLEIFHNTVLAPNPEWMQYLETLAGQVAIAIDSHDLLENLQSSAEELLQAYDATIEGWSQAMDLRDRETEGHTQRVTELTLKLARTVGVPASELIHIRRGALLHDIGKLGVPDSILLKPGPLDAQEWALMKQHPQLAYDMLKQVTYLVPALEIPHCHHEKWDGSGYPAGLRGEEIPYAARIFALVDVWDAVTNERPYHAAWSAEEALNHIRQQSGTHFDPALVELFVTVLTSDDEQEGKP